MTKDDVKRLLKIAEYMQPDMELRVNTDESIVMTMRVDTGRAIFKIRQKHKRKFFTFAVPLLWGYSNDGIHIFLEVCKDIRLNGVEDE